MSERKVHFSEPIHHIEYLDKQWDTASRLARDGSDWIRMVADRQRFKDRIERTAETLNRILDFEFRQEIYQQRFENFVTPEYKERSNKEPTQIITVTTQRTTVSEEVHKQQSQSQQLPQQPPQQNNRQRRKSKNNKRQKHRGRHRKHQ